MAEGCQHLFFDALLKRCMHGTIAARAFYGFGIGRRHCAVDNIEIRIQERCKTSRLFCRETGREIAGGSDFSDVWFFPRDFRNFPASQNKKRLLAVSCHPFDHTAHKSPFKS
jgi:hypothetical protein